MIVSNIYDCIEYYYNCVKVRNYNEFTNAMSSNFKPI